YAREKFQGAFDLGQLVDTRERRQIVGDFTITILDQASGRTFPDTIAKAYTSYDTHGYIVDPYLLLRHPLRQKFTSYVPYRCLLPRGREGLIVTGIGLSAHRDAQPIVRMQPDVQNFGYAAGAAAAMAAGEGVGVRQIDIRKLQRHLADVGILDEEVLTHTDSYPLPTEHVESAVKTMLDNYRSLAILLNHADTALPLLQEAYRMSDGAKKIAYAKVLAMMGDSAGASTLVSEIQRITEWDAPPAWNIGSDYPEAAQVGWGMSHLDNTLVALGRCRSNEALPAILEKLASLDAKTSFSHHRAACGALEWLGDPRAAEALGELLQKPGMSGYATGSIDARAASHSTRSEATRELLVARALYRCGDWQGLAEKTLKAYSTDLRGHFARHAKAVLDAGKDYRPKPR
ncbi:MAG: FAD-dependent oxidoreductase, partial [Thermoguttaceae bacterium]